MRKFIVSGMAMLMALGAIGAVASVGAESANTCVTCYQDLNFGGGGSVWCGEYGEPGGGQPARSCTVSEVCDEWYCDPEECCLHCQWEGTCPGSFAAAPISSPAGRYIPTPQYRSRLVDGRLVQACSGYVIHDGSVARGNNNGEDTRIVI